MALQQGRDAVEEALDETRIASELIDQGAMGGPAKHFGDAQRQASEGLMRELILQFGSSVPSLTDREAVGGRRRPSFDACASSEVGYQRVEGGSLS